MVMFGAANESAITLGFPIGSKVGQSPR
jgi:hypothetical protein